MSLQNKPQMVEAVLFFNKQGVCRQMLYPEFEAVLDNVVQLHDFADQDVRCAYVLINPRLLVKSCVLFVLDFDERGQADRGWNIPLRHLAEQAGRGPDLGAGPIRLACRSQCPVSWHQMHLWDPDLTPAHNELAILRDAVKRNALGLLVEEDETPPVALENLQMVSEDRWYNPQSATREVVEQRASEQEQTQRDKTAQQLKQLRLRVTAQTQKHELELAQLRQQAEQQRQQAQATLQQLESTLQQQVALNASLKNELTAQAQAFQQTRKELTQQLRDMEQAERGETDLLRSQLEAELSARISAAVVDSREQVALRDVELAYRKEQETRQQQELQSLRAELEQLRQQGGGQVLEKLARQGVVFVAYHPGAGHLTLPLQDIAIYQENPQAYVAVKCFVSEAQYRHWLAHYQQPNCEVLLPSGERCAMPIDRVDTPSRFVLGETNCCARHKASNRLRTVG